MKMESDKESKYEKAKKRVATIRGFYNHLAVYIIVNLILFLFRNKIRFTLISAEALGDPLFLEWLDWNVFGTSIVWGIVLLVHGAKVFGWIPVFNKKWEERQFRKFMNEERDR